MGRLKSIIHAQNVYELVRPDRFGIELSYFCEKLNEHLHDPHMYPPNHLSDLFNSKKMLPGIRLDVQFNLDGKVQIRSQTLNTNLFISTPQPFVPLQIWVVEDVSGLGWSTVKIREVISVPLRACFSNEPNLSDTYTVYAHTFTCKDNFLKFKGVFNLFVETEPSYVGVTKRGWVSRWNEHLTAARTGSPYRFHEAIRRFAVQNPVYHEVVSCGLSYDDAMKSEEIAVDHFSLYPKGFNMIPGGEAGIKYLADKGFPQTKKSWEQRERSIRALTDECARKGIANPLVSALWRDDDYAASIICGNPNNFNLEKVHQIRFMAEVGKTSEQIAKHLGCSLDRVKRLLGGDTYSRVA